MIELAGVSKVYRTTRGEVRAVDDVTLSIGAGEFVALKGHSGSGKSTLLALLGGLALPSTGSVSVAGYDVGKLSSSQRARFREENVGFVFQMFHLLPYLNVLDNVLVASPAATRSSSRDYAKQLLNGFGMESRIMHRPSQLSAGERQRVAMARAVLNRPKLLLADEPTGNLDEKNADDLLNFLLAYHLGGSTIVLATHDDRATWMVDRIIELSSGKLVSPADSFS